MNPPQPDDKKHMSFDEALAHLGIVEYRSRIWNSNSHGELHHCLDYIKLAQYFDTPEKAQWFAKAFEFIVKQAEEHWKRPDSIFQHIPKALDDLMTELAQSPPP